MPLFELARRQSRALLEDPVECGLGAESGVEGDVQDVGFFLGIGKAFLDFGDPVIGDEIGESPAHPPVDEAGELVRLEGEAFGQGVQRKAAVAIDLFDLEVVIQALDSFLSRIGVQADLPFPVPVPAPPLPQNALDDESAQKNDRREHADEEGRDGLALLRRERADDRSTPSRRSSKPLFDRIVSRALSQACPRKVKRSFVELSGGPILNLNPLISSNFVRISASAASSKRNSIGSPEKAFVLRFLTSWRGVIFRWFASPTQGKKRTVHPATNKTATAGAAPFSPRR